MFPITQSTQQLLPVRVFDTGNNPVTGLAYTSIAALAVKSDGTTQAVTLSSGADWTEVGGALAGSGTYLIRISAGNCDTLGFLVIGATSTGNRPSEVVCSVRAYDETSLHNSIAAIPTNPLLTTDSRLNNLDAAVSSASAPSAATVAAAVWDEALAGHSTAGTAGKDLADTYTAATGVRTDYTTGKAAYLDAAISTRAPSATALTDATWTNAKAAFLDAAISTRAIPTDIPPKGEVAAAVWEEDLQPHLTPGTAGAALENTLVATEALRTHQEGRWKIHTSGPDANRIVFYDPATDQPVLKFDTKDVGGAPTVLSILERVRVDFVAPSFAGATFASALSSTEVLVGWNTGSDDETTSSAIVYDLYVATSTGTQNYTTPTSSSTPGASTHLLTGLTPDQPYYVVVRARDASGNRDSNIVEVSATPTALVYNWKQGSPAGTGKSQSDFSMAWVGPGAAITAGGQALGAANSDSYYFTMGGYTLSTTALAMQDALLGRRTARTSRTGTVIVAGGTTGAGLSSMGAEKFVAATPAWVAIGDMARRLAYGAMATGAPTLTYGDYVYYCGGISNMTGPAVSGALVRYNGDAANAWDTWKVMADLPSPRAYHQMVTLPNGELLVLGGIISDLSTTNTCWVYNPGSNAWVAAADLAVERKNFSAVVLANGTVLVMGGTNNANVALASVESRNANTGVWTTKASMPGVGGIISASVGYENGVEVVFVVTETGVYKYVPGTNTWTTLSAPSGTHAAGFGLVVLDGGAEVLVVGNTNAGAVDGPVDLYRKTPPLPPTPINFLATTFSSTEIDVTWTDNSALESGFEIWRAPDVTGSPGTWALIHTTAAGIQSYNNTGLSSSTTYWYRMRAINAYGESAYTSNTSATTAAGTLNWPNYSWATAGFGGAYRAECSWEKLGDGRVVVFAGYDDTFAAITQTDIFAADGTGVVTGGATPVGYGKAARSCVLGDGRILVAGGNPSGTSIDDVATFASGADVWTARAPLPAARSYGCLITLASGDAVYFGGVDAGGSATDSVYKYVQASNTWSTLANMNVARKTQSVVRLADDTILIAGGDNAGLLLSAEIFDPGTGLCTPVASMANPNYINQTPLAVLLPDNRALFVCGTSGLTQAYTPGTNTWNPGLAFNSKAATTTQGQKFGSILPGPYTNPGPFVLLIQGNWTPAGTGDVVEAYDVTNDNWRLLNPLPAKRADGAVQVLNNGKVLSIGGYDETITPTFTVYVGTPA
jgi:N-acetylneuraminic acid mutarotase